MSCLKNLRTNALLDKRVGGHMNFAIRRAYDKFIWRTKSRFKSLFSVSLMQKPQLLSTRISLTFLHLRILAQKTHPKGIMLINIQMEPFVILRINHEKLRLFQEERPVWYTIHCNVLPKDDKEIKVTEEFKKNERIVTVTDGKDPSNDDLS
ncbi:hypothetical protein TorRG33x02_030970 [Trema orientale]|uniref:Uncharacterized protein n=1 Tax=Trema orientale TaxID=63057 RepID=A0A2P5FU68_TREOI|nr:hypothetical protein TorRG33x02_030970 [Trema orientale]